MRGPPPLSSFYSTTWSLVQRLFLMVIGRNLRRHEATMSTSPMPSSPRVSRPTRCCQPFTAWLRYSNAGSWGPTRARTATTTLTTTWPELTFRSNCRKSPHRGLTVLPADVAGRQGSAPSLRRHREEPPAQTNTAHCSHEQTGAPATVVCLRVQRPWWSNTPTMWCRCCKGIHEARPWRCKDWRQHNEEQGADSDFGT